MQAINYLIHIDRLTRTNRTSYPLGNLYISQKSGLG
jgi:hypothetical protein